MGKWARCLERNVKVCCRCPVQALAQGAPRMWSPDWTLRRLLRGRIPPAASQPAPAAARLQAADTKQVCREIPRALQNN